MTTLETQKIKPEQKEDQEEDTTRRTQIIPVLTITAITTTIKMTMNTLMLQNSPSSSARKLRIEQITTAPSTDAEETTTYRTAPKTIPLHTAKLDP